MLAELLTEKRIELMKEKNSAKEDNGVKEAANIKLASISVLNAEVQKLIKEKKADITILEEHKIVSKAIDNLKEPLEEAKKHNRTDSLAPILVELTFLSEIMSEVLKHMPKQLNEEEIRVEIEKLMEEIRDTQNVQVFTKKNMGVLMKELKVRLEGKADMKVVSRILSSLLK